MSWTLQKGVPAEQVREALFQEYLVETTTPKLQAHRRTCAQTGDYWTLEHLELHHWEFGYQQTSRWKGPQRLLGVE